MRYDYLNILMRKLNFTFCLIIMIIWGFNSSLAQVSTSNPSSINTRSESISDSKQNSYFPAIIPTSISGLVFEKAVEYRIQEEEYTDILQLKNLSNKAQAIQFRLMINKSVDDSTFLIYEGIEKGSDISDASWVLNHNLVRGPLLANGASQDELYVLIYNLQQDNGLPPGDYEELFKVHYKIAALPDLQDSVKTSIKIAHTQASTYQGTPIDITPSRDEFIIKVKAPVVIPRFGLIFEQDTVYRLEDDSYTDIIQLINLDSKAQALQFRLLINKSYDDSSVLTFQNIQKGSDVSDQSWALNYNVFRGPLTSNGASVDSIYVLLYNLGQNSGLPPGNYNDLLKVKYRVADLQALQDSVKSSIRISHAEASTYHGFPINITPSIDELTVIVKNRVGLYGDVNGDGCLDILDIIMVVDHIIGKDSLSADEFLRADIAPWVIGSDEPNPDGFVNVMDLSLLQNIILTGVYPNGTQINNCSFTGKLAKASQSDENLATFYINKSGITVYLNTEVDIRGAQIEFGNVINSPNNMLINTYIGNGYYQKVNDLLRVLLYDRNGEKVIKAGKNYLANIPFNINTPEDITIEKLYLVDVNRQKISGNEIEIIYGNPPVLPFDYLLYQNYPNPFNASTTIQYSVPVISSVIIKIYDLLGNEITTLLSDEKNPGVHTIKFDNINLSSGVYFYKITAFPTMESDKIFTQTKKMVLLK